MTKYRKKKVITIVALLIAVIGLSIGFSALSTLLNIETNIAVNPNKGELGVMFSSSETSLKTDSIKPITSSKVVDAKDAIIDNSGTPTIKNLSVALTSPGQSATYEFYAMNTGSVTAYLNSINFGEKKCEANTGTSQESVDSACSGISVSIKFGSDTTEYTETTTLTGHPLSTNTVEKVTVTIMYAKDASEADGGFKVNYGTISVGYNAIDGGSVTPSTETCFISTAAGELTAYDSSCSKDVVIDENLELPLSTIKSVQYVESKCVAYMLKSYSELTEAEAKEYCSEYETTLATAEIPLTMKMQIGDVELEVDESNKSTITKIGMGAFVGLGITSVTMPSNLTEIGAYAFQLNNLTDVAMPSMLVSILEGAFDSNKLTSIELPDSVTTVGSHAFSDNKITNIKFSTGLSSIESSVFRGNLLESLEIPDNITQIGSSAFEENNISNLTLSNTLTKISDSAFENNSLTSVSIPDSVTIIGTAAFKENNISNLILSNALTEINSSAFYANSLTNVSIPNSVTTIGMSAFDCNNLTTITIGSGVTNVGSQAFSGNIHQGSTGKSYGPNSITSVTINQAKSDIFNGIFGWADGYTDSNIVFNG